MGRYDILLKRKSKEGIRDDDLGERKHRCGRDPDDEEKRDPDLELEEWAQNMAELKARLGQSHHNDINIAEIPHLNATVQPSNPYGSQPPENLREPERNGSALQHLPRRGDRRPNPPLSGLCSRMVDLLSTEALRVDGDAEITGDLTIRGAINRPEMIINPAYSRIFFIRTGQRIKYFISRLFKQPRLKIVWSEQLSPEDLDNLREQVHLALEDPEHVIVSNYEIHVESIKF